MSIDLPQPSPRAAVRRPLVGALLALLAGAAVGIGLHPPAWPLLAGAALMLAVAVTCVRRPSSSAWLYAAWALAAAAHFGMAFRHPTGRDVAALMDRPREHMELLGVVTGDAEREVGRRPDEARWTFPFHVEGIQRLGEWQRASGRVRCRWTTRGAEPPPEYGERWRVVGALSALPARTGSGLPLLMLETGVEDSVRLNVGRGSSIMRACLRARRASARLLTHGIESYPEQAGLLRALMLGYRRDLPDELRRDFRATGTAHILAISGTHLAILALLLLALARAAGLSREHWILVVGPLLILYTMATGLSASTVRACVMALAYGAAFLLKRRPDALSSLALAAILILAAAPEQLCEAGFLFSFSAVLGLILITPALAERFLALVKPDPWRLQKESFWVHGARRWAAALVLMLATSTAAWLATMPLTAHYFNLVSPVALLANLFIIPLAVVIMLTGCLSLGVGWLWGAWGEVFNHANRVFVTLFLWGIDRAGAIPGGHWFIRAPGGCAVVAWYAVLAVWLWGGRRLRRVTLAGLAVAAAAGLTLYAADTKVRVEAPDFSGVPTVFVDAPRDGDLLINPGPRFAADRVERYLRKQGVDRLEALVVTRPVAECAGAVPDLIERIRVRELWYPAGPVRSPVFRAALDAAEKRGVRVRPLQRGDAGALTGGVEWEALHPPEPPAAAEAALVLRLARGAASVLIAVGSGPAGERDMLGAPVELTGAVLLTGGRMPPESGAPEWLEAVGASDAIVIASPAGIDEGLLSRLRAREMRVWRTDQEGVVRVEWVGEGRMWEVRAGAHRSAP